MHMLSRSWVCCRWFQARVRPSSPSCPSSFLLSLAQPRQHTLSRSRPLHTLNQALGQLGFIPGPTWRLPSLWPLAEKFRQQLGWWKPLLMKVSLVFTTMLYWCWVLSTRTSWAWRAHRRDSGQHSDLSRKRCVSRGTEFAKAAWAIEPPPAEPAEVAPGSGDRENCANANAAPMPLPAPSWVAWW